ncbi:MAG: hypothetical protein ACLP5H_29385 [Desulfomonilaceae bacterium]
MGNWVIHFTPLGLQKSGFQGQCRGLGEKTVNHVVTLAKAGVRRMGKAWIPACGGMTETFCISRMRLGS